MNTAAAPENWEGQIVDGKFPLLKWLGGTQRGDVFRTQLPAKEPQMAAIKLIPAGADAEKQISRWQMAATLTHPHLLRVLHAGQCKIGNIPHVYVVMEYAEEDLSEVLPARALSAGEVREMMPPLLDGISYLHSRGLVHGRVKPSNIMAVADQLKLSTDSVHSVSEAGEPGLPSTAFDAPEVRRGVVSRPEDIWSLGVTLVRCLSPGKQARENYNPIEQGIAQTIPEPFRHIARECLRPDPKSRCSLADIREWLRSAAVSSAAVQQKPGRPAPSLRVWAIMAAIVLVVTIFAWRWIAHGKQEAPVSPAPQSSASSNTASQSSPSLPAAAPVPAPKPAPAHVPAAAAPVAKPPVHSTQDRVIEAGADEGAIVERVVPEIPASARNTIQGRVRVNVRIAVNSAGEVSEATLASPGPSKYFANKALDAARRWKFKPAEAGGSSRASEWMLRFQFGRGSTEVIPTELQSGSH
jgi:TonB family protein